MRSLTRVLVALLTVAVLFVFGGQVGKVVMAQGEQQQPAAAGNAGQRDAQPGEGRRGNFDPAQMRERMRERMKEGLQATDDEWKVIEPRIEKVMDLQARSRFGGFGGMGGRGMGGRGPGEQGQRDQGAREQRAPEQGAGEQGARDQGRGRFGPPSPEAEALGKALESKDTPKEQIQAALKSFRDARAKREKELESARQELRDVLTLRQEAQLVLYGLLD